MKSYKDVAYQILKAEQKPLHYRELTDIANKTGVLKTNGKTPWATMNAQLSLDIIKYGKSSRFIRTSPGHYYLNHEYLASNNNPAIRFNIEKTIITYKKDGERLEKIYRFPISSMISTKQKGDIVEARVSELISLYGDEGLSCFRPVSDDEGIDLIAKRRGKLDVVYIQVKSTFGDGRSRGFVSTVKEKSIQNKSRMLMVFAYFDLSVGDLFDQIFCVPAPDFLRLTSNENKKSGERVFTVGLSNPDKSKYAEFMIEKRELANRIREIMDKL